MAALCFATPIAAQESPSDVAEAFYEAIGSHRWTTATATVHPETLDLFQYRMVSMLDADPDGALSQLVFSEPDGPSVRERASSDVFASILAAIERDTPGLIAILATNEYRPVGHVPEGEDLAHVVLRVTPYTNGSAPTRTIVVTLKRHGERWGILESGELDSLATAMTGLALSVRGPEDDAP